MKGSHLNEKSPSNALDSDPRVVELMRKYKNGGSNFEDAVNEMQKLTGLSRVVCEVFLGVITRKNVVDLKRPPREG